MEALIPPVRARFKSSQELYAFIQQCTKVEEGSNKIDLAPLFLARLECYRKIETLRGRKVLVYAGNFPGNLLTSGIDLNDIQGFTDLINTRNSYQNELLKEVDVLIHSPGGMPDATERIVCLLRSHFKKVNVLIPHSAYSAATMLALSANEVILHKSAVLGPIDPQINGVPAKSIKRGFENAIKKIQEDGVTSIPAYVPLLAKYDLQLLELCDDAEKLSVELATEWLTKYMLEGKSQEDVRDIVKFFSDFDNHHIHSRPITFEKIKSFGMNIKYAEEALNELMWEAFLLISGFFNITKHQNISKLYENSCPRRKLAICAFR